MIEAKRKGKEVSQAPKPEEEEPADLMAALRASIETAKGKRRPERALTRSRNLARGDDDLAQLSKAELEERARKAKISGRSKMSKQQLVKALGNAE